MLQHSFREADKQRGDVLDCAQRCVKPAGTVRELCGDATPRRLSLVQEVRLGAKPKKGLKAVFFREAAQKKVPLCPGKVI